jgi:hypothetical protein
VLDAFNLKCPIKIKNIQFTESNGWIQAARSFAWDAKDFPLLEGAAPIFNFLA